MNDKTALLDQLRIDRPKHVQRAPGRRRLWWLVGIVAAIVVGAGTVYALAGARIPVHSVVAKAASTASPASNAGSLLDASGYVVALREATVSGKSIYKVNEVLIQEGQQVKQGQVMARLDDTNARAALEQSKAQVKQLEASLDAARVAAADARPLFTRNQGQLAEGLISQDTFDASKAIYDAAQTAVTVAEQNLAVARATMEINQRYEDDTIIKAPFNGVVTVKTAHPGEIVSPQFQGGGGIAKIVDMDSLEVEVDVSENFINRVHSSQPATVTLNAYPDWQIPGEVVAVIPTADRAKATVKVRIGFKVKDARIVPEMGAHVSFLDRESPHETSAPVATTVMVPAEAVQGSGDGAAVFVIDDSRVSKRDVRLVSRMADGQVVLTGLQIGVSLAVGELDKLRDGSRVRVLP
jgi:RND family efflux transporter MFP subunit